MQAKTHKETFWAEERRQVLALIERRPSEPEAHMTARADCIWKWSWHTEKTDREGEKSDPEEGSWWAIFLKAVAKEPMTQLNENVWFLTHRLRAQHSILTAVRGHREGMASSCVWRRLRQQEHQAACPQHHKAEDRPKVTLGCKTSMSTLCSPLPLVWDHLQRVHILPNTASSWVPSVQPHMSAPGISHWNHTTT